MDDGEVEPSDYVLVGNPSSSGNIQGSASVDSYLEELFKNTRSCTHTHTCYPPGPDAVHTHTCYHTHTHVFSSGEEDKSCSSKKPKKPLGNREAVRKYREKKKAHAAHMEEEVKKLRLMNQQLVRKLQGQAILEAEIMRLRSLLFGIKGKIDNELGSFPFQKQSSISFKEAECGTQSSSVTVTVGLPCEDGAPPFNPSVKSSLPTSCIGRGEKAVFSWARSCEPAIVDCQASEMASVAECPISTSETFISSTKPAQ